MNDRTLLSAFRVFGNSVVCSLPIKPFVCVCVCVCVCVRACVRVHVSVCLVMQRSLPSCPNVTTLPFPTIHQMMSVRFRCFVTTVTESKWLCISIKSCFKKWFIALLLYSALCAVATSEWPFLNAGHSSALNDIFPHMLFLRNSQSIFSFPETLFSGSCTAVCLVTDLSLSL